MTNQITTHAHNQTISSNIDYKQMAMDWLQSTNAKLDQNEIKQFITLCQVHGLNPFKREIYAIKYGNNLNIVVGYEVYVKRALNSNLCDGYSTHFDKDNQGGLKCTATIYRKSMKHPIIHTCYLNEVKQNNNMWNSKPRMMLEKTTLSQGLRRAFGDVIDGLPYTQEEMPEGEIVGNQVDSNPLGNPTTITEAPTATQAVPATALPDVENIF